LKKKSRIPTFLKVSCVALATFGCFAHFSSSLPLNESAPIAFKPTNLSHLETVPSPTCFPPFFETHSTLEHVSNSSDSFSIYQAAIDVRPMPLIDKRNFISQPFHRERVISECSNSSVSSIFKPKAPAQQPPMLTLPNTSPSKMSAQSREFVVPQMHFFASSLLTFSIFGLVSTYISRKTKRLNDRPNTSETPTPTGSTNRIDLTPLSSSQNRPQPELTDPTTPKPMRPINESSHTSQTPPRTPRVSNKIDNLQLFHWGNDINTISFTIHRSDNNKSFYFNIKKLQTGYQFLSTQPTPKTPQAHDNTRKDEFTFSYKGDNALKKVKNRIRNHLIKPLFDLQKDGKIHRKYEPLHQIIYEKIEALKAIPSD